MLYSISVAIKYYTYLQAPKHVQMYILQVVDILLTELITDLSEKNLRPGPSLTPGKAAVASETSQDDM